MRVFARYFGVIVLGFVGLYSGKSNAEICWDPLKTIPTISTLGQETEDRYKDYVTNPKNPKGKKSRNSNYSKTNKSSGNYTMSSGSCENDPPTPKPSRGNTPSVSVTNSTSGTYTVSWSASSNMDTSPRGQWGYELSEYKNGTFVKKYTTVPTTRNQTISNNPDANYQYKVRGCNHDYRMGVPVCGYYSSLSPTNRVRHKPSKPSAPSTTSPTSTGTIDLSWSKPAGTVTKYNIREYKNGTLSRTLTTSYSSLFLTGLSNGSYTYKVRACNDYSWACSSYSSGSTETTVLHTPQVPQNLGLELGSSRTFVLIHGDVPFLVPVDVRNVSWSSVADAEFYEYRLCVDGVCGDWEVTESPLVDLDSGISGSLTVEVRACNRFPDNTKNCSSTVTSDVIDVQLPSDGEVDDEPPGQTDDLLGQNVGTIEGKAGVSGGAAIYSIPIQAPPGRKGMQPDISLSYSSRARSGIAGKGWSLNAGGSVHRCALLWELDQDSRNINLTNKDKLCLDGTRLILDSGTYGHDSAIYRPETSPNIKVIQTNGINDSDSSFKVEYSNGGISHYGTTDDSRLSRSGTTVNSRWLLKKREDAPSKNNIIYSYSASGDAGSRYLTTITYTGFNGSAGNRKVEFSYGNRNDNGESYLLGTFSKSTKRLTKIQTKVNGSLATEYSLNYRTVDDAEPVAYQEINSSGQLQYSSNLSTSGVSHKTRPDSASLLKSIKQCAWDDNGTKECLPETEFTLQSFDPDVSTTQKLTSFSDGSHWPSINETGFNGEFDNSFDIDGDGVPDIGYATDTAITGYSHVWLSSKRKYYAVPSGFHSLGSKFNSDKKPQSNLTIDWNRDGKQDLVGKKYISNEYTNGHYLSILYWDSQSSTLKTKDFQGIDAKCVSAYSFENPRPSPTDPGPPTYQRSCYGYGLDANGDGAKDLVIATRPANAAFTTSQGVTLQLYLSCEASGIHSLCPTNAVESVKVDTPARNIDFDGDGKQELVFRVNGLGDIMSHAQELVYRVVKINGQWSFEITDTGLNIGNKLTTYHYQDLNGDGLQDVLYQEATSGNWFFRKNTGSGYAAKNSITSLPSTVREYFTSDKYLGGYFRFFDYDQDGLLDIIAPTELKYEASCDSDNYNRCDRQSLFTNTSVYPYDRFDLYEWTIYRAKLNTTGKLSYQAVQGANVDIVAPLLDLEVIDYNADGAYDLITRLGRDDEGFTVIGKHFSMNGPYSRGIYAYRNPNSRVDFLLKAKNGLGVTEEFGYQGLYQPSDFNKSQSQRFYDVDLSSNANSWPYSYFGTATQMVAVHNTDDGVGGVISSKLQYRNARYHHQGRGFQGFGEIIEAKPQLGVKSSTKYQQAYPLSGRVRQASQYAKNASGIYQQVAKSISSYKTQKNNGVYTIYTDQNDSYTYDLATGDELTHKIVTQSNVDEWGNVGTRIESHSDEFGTVTTKKTHTFAPQTGSTWWPNKKIKTVVDYNPVEERTSGASIAENTDVIKSVTTDYLSFHSAYRVPTSVKTSASDTSLTTRVGTTLTTYGLPKSVTTYGTHADDTAMTARTVSTTYTTGTDVGYFPETVENAKGHTVSTTTDARTGKPLSVTDANSVTSTTIYDAFGREQRQTVPGGQAVETAYYWCVSNCPTYGVYYRKTIQSGSPISIEYFDKLGRSLGTNNEGFDGRMIAQRVTYNSKGQKTFESVPYFENGGNSELGTHYESYDNLGRLTKKRVNQTVSDMIVSYSYNGLVTDIDVTGGDMPLPMQRAYNGLKQLIYTKDAKGNYTRYAYDGAGNPIALQDAGGNTIDAWYNGLGHKTKVDDPNMGIKTFSYNSLGEVEREEDANGHILTYTYDTLGRMKTRKVGGSLQANMTYDTRKKGLLSSESGAITKNYYYDDKSRPTLVRHSIDGTDYDVETAYDANYGFVKSLKYPSDFTVGYKYNSRGYLTKQFNAKEPEHIYQEVTAQDAYQNITGAKLANDVLTQTQVFYEATGQMATSQVQLTSGAKDRHYLSYLYDGYGNLQQQTVYYDDGADTQETYQYDSLHRLKTAQRVFSNGAATQTNSYTYDNLGNFQSKSDYGTTYNYDNLPNAVSSVIKLDGTTVNFDYDANGNMTSGDGKSLTYNAFNKPLTVTKDSIISTFEYGPDLSRYKQIKEGGEDGIVTTTYIDKLYEKVVTNKAGQANTTEYKHYIGDVAILTTTEVAGQETPERTINYTLRDRLGSVVTLTNHQGDITEFRSYDAFGKPRKGTMENVDPAKPATLSEIAKASSYFKQTTRGFTDHEHLDDAELIHMNGRAYDHNLGRFLSVDPFIQEPGNSQSMNPYSYIMNNPLAGTDPTGYVAKRNNDSPNNGSNSCPSQTCVDLVAESGGVSGGNGADTSNTEKTDNSDIKPTNTSSSSSLDSGEDKSGYHLSSDQYDELKGLASEGRRTEYYVRLYEMTGSQLAIQMAQISSNSGFIGGVAWKANLDIKLDLSKKYPGSVKDFSTVIFLNDYAQITPNESGGFTVPNDTEMLKATVKVWERAGLGGVAPPQVRLDNEKFGMSMGMLNSLLRVPAAKYVINATFNETYGERVGIYREQFIKDHETVDVGYTSDGRYMILTGEKSYNNINNHPNKDVVVYPTFQ